MIRNDQPWPTAWIRIPDSAGPTSAPNWKTEELRLTALRMWWSPTSSETNTCRVGLSTTVTKPSSIATTIDVPDLGGAGQGEQSQRGRQRSPPSTG